MPPVPASRVTIAAVEQGGAAGTPDAIQPATPQAFNPLEARRTYDGLLAQRTVLRSQLGDLEEQRADVRREYQQAQSGVDQTGLEQRLAGIDQRIAKTSIDLAEVESKLVVAAGRPGAVPTNQAPGDFPRVNDHSDELFAMGIAFSALLAFPIVIAYARRIWNRSAAPAAAALPPELSERIRAMERSLESVAVEVERIGEGQRFVTQLLASRSDAEAMKQLK
ncbi:MAG: hypothetical protein IT357_01720 [Gemmatimonadaceae bacterium]|nr:hypothetical protein [Gemmatimonadaceae bacterium]